MKASVAALQTWVLEPSLQKEVNEAIAQLESYAKPTIAFHGVIPRFD